jgi:vacuolar-type H+-ATPase subunit I/STV1
MSSKLSRLEIIDQRLGELEKNVSFVNKEIQEMKEMKLKVTEIEKGVTYLSNQYDDQQKEIAEMKNTVKEINKRHDNRSAMAELREASQDLSQQKESHLDLQTQSMRDNLVFEGIPKRSGENTEEVIKNSIQTELDISDEIDFYRVHKMGKQRAKKHTYPKT